MIEALTALLRVLKQLGIRYFAVGSVASSIHGVPRFTQDVDLVAEVSETQIDSLASLTAADYYMDRDEARSALSRGSAFNLIHMATGFKMDIFPLRPTAFHAAEMERAKAQDWVIPGGGTVRLTVATAEDTILSKLLWYRQENQVSDRQWSDLLGVASRPALDWLYMHEWAPRLGVADLLEKLFSESSQIRAD